MVCSEFIRENTPPDIHPVPKKLHGAGVLFPGSGVGRALRYRFVPDGEQRRNSPLEPSFRRCQKRCPSFVGTVISAVAVLGD